MSIHEFLEQYATNELCLDKILAIKHEKTGMCPGCESRKAKFSRINTRLCYQCSRCKYQYYPMAGSIFEKSTTPLTKWFYAIYMMSVTRNGVSAKEIQRALGVTYKTAWRMGHQIRELMSNKPQLHLKGDVMIDETYIGGQERNKHKNKRKKIVGYEGKTPVFAMMEKSGRVIASTINVNSLNGDIVKPIIRQHIEPGSTIITDGFGAYTGLSKEYTHEIVNHERDEYVNANGYSTNAIESYFSGLKRMIRGTHIHVSPKYLPYYIAENTFRFENRDKANEMFEIALRQII